MPKEQFTLTLDAYATQAAYWLLTKGETKGRKEGKRVRQSIKALKQGTMKRLSTDFEWSFIGGNATMKLDYWEAILKAGEKVYDEGGVPGQYVEGMDELLDRIDELLFEQKHREREDNEEEEEEEKEEAA